MATAEQQDRRRHLRTRISWPGVIRVGALVWRADADGLAFLFGRVIQHRFIRAA